MPLCQDWTEVADGKTEKEKKRNGVFELHLIYS